MGMRFPKLGRQLCYPLLAVLFLGMLFRTDLPFTPGTAVGRITNIGNYKHPVHQESNERFLFNNKPLASFMIAGVQKGGTTVLSKYMHFQCKGIISMQHNEIRFPYSKSNADRQQRKRDYVAFESSFELTETQKNELSLGKSSIMYGFKDPLEHKADELRRYNPDMKLIFSFRHPIKRFVSWYNHFCIFFKVKSPCCTFWDQISTK